jgi:hypothetical protein
MEMGERKVGEEEEVAGRPWVAAAPACLPGAGGREEGREEGLG